MKRQVQQTGVRKWFGDDWISMQNELFSVLEGFFGSCGQQFILSGCVVAGNDIGAGIVGLIDGEGFHICRFSGAQAVAWPVYFYPSKITENRAYLDNQVKPVSEAWTVAISGNSPGGYFQLKQDGTSARFLDAIQTANRRFITDAEKTGYAAQASSAITTIRDGVVSDYDTLAKIVTLVLLKANTNSPALTGIPTAPTAVAGTNTTQIATTAFIQAAIASLVASSPAALDTLNELAAALGNDPNFATTMTNALAGKLTKASNLSDLQNEVTARINLGLGNVNNTSDVNKPVSTAQQTALDLKANLTSPALTGVPTTPTPALGTNTTQIVNAAFVQAAIAALVSSSPAALDTLNELAAALGNDANFATTMTNALAGKQPLDADLTAIAALLGTSGFLKKTADDTWALDTNVYLTAITKAMVETVLTGVITTHSHTVTKADVGLGNADNTSDANKPVSTAQQTALNLKAPLASPALTGVPTTPTPAPGTNTTQVVNAAFVQAAIAALVASSPAALDTLNELAAALGNDANFATTMTNALANKLNRNFDNISNVVATLTALGVEGTEALSGTDIDWLGKPVRTKTLKVATTLTFSNLVVNKTISLKITGAYTLALPGSVTTIAGEYDGSKNNLIQLLCINATTPEVWCTISQPKS